MAIHVEDDRGRTGVVLVEVKLSEGGYTHCNGATSDANMRKDVCADASKFFDEPRACYLRWPRHARRDRRYWDIFEAAFGSVRAAVPGFAGERCPFEGNHQQLMRNHALALGLTQAGGNGVRGRSGSFTIRTTTMCWNRGTSTGRSLPTRSPLFRIPADQLVNAAAGQDASWAAWACYMRERYMLPAVGASA